MKKFKKFSPIVITKKQPSLEELARFEDEGKRVESVKKIINSDNGIVEDYLKKFGLPAEKIYTLFIDPIRWHTPKSPEAGIGKDAFEHENKGYYQGCVDGWKQLIAFESQKMDSRKLASLHDSVIVRNQRTAVSSVSQMGLGYAHSGSRKFSWSKLVSNESSDLLELGEITPEAIDELKKRDNISVYDLRENQTSTNTNNENIIACMEIMSESKINWNTCDNSESNNQAEDNQLFEEYYSNIAKSSNNDEKIFLIAGLVREIELRHRFEDANGRTSVLLMNKLLIDEGLRPTILHNPNMIDGLSAKQLADQIQKGMLRFNSICQEEQPGSSPASP